MAAKSRNAPFGSLLHLLLGVWTFSAFAGDFPTKPPGDPVLLGDLPAVEAAALHAQTLAEAPANVSVLTAADIRRYGYRTLAEALSSVRGFYATYDHIYHFVGVRGLSLPGDYNTRFLVMLNGHPLTDNIYDSNGFFGQDFGLDLDLVERIEIIRGPTSALYGSNGMLANINVVTRSPVDSAGLRLATETDSFGAHKASLAAARHLGGGANLLIALSAFYGDGVETADRERGYHTFANLIWHDWSFTAYFNSRDKQVPVGYGSSVSADPSQHAVDSRNLLAAAYKRRRGPGELRWQFAYDQYRYRDRFNYQTADEHESVADFNRGDWVDSQLTYELPVGGVGPLTAGLRGSWELRNQQYNIIDGRRENIFSRPDRAVAVFAQQQWDLGPRWRIYAGVRLDHTRNYRTSVSPRLAAVFQSSPGAVSKLVYGRPFRNPSAFEQFYTDGGLSYTAAPPLRPEAAHTIEFSHERQLSRRFSLVVNAFHYCIGRVIEAVMLDSGAQQYRNAGRLRTTGIEFEWNGRFGLLEASAGTVFQSATGEGGRLPNSPRNLSTFRLAAPLWHERLWLSAAARSFSARAAQGRDGLGGALLQDFTATLRLNRRFDLQAGLRNAFDRRYEDPVYLSLDRLPGDSRSVFLKLVCRVWE